MHGGYLLFGEGVTVTHSRCASVRYLVIPKPHVSGCVTRPDSSQSMCTSAPGPHLKKATSGEFNGGQIRRTWGRRGSVDAAPGGGEEATRALRKGIDCSSDRKSNRAGESASQPRRVIHFSIVVRKGSKRVQNTLNWG